MKHFFYWKNVIVLILYYINLKYFVTLLHIGTQSKFGVLLHRTEISMLIDVTHTPESLLNTLLSHYSITMFRYDSIR